MKAEAKVYLVGAGPGDPDLLTVKAYRLLQDCDVVIYDRLVSEAILELVGPGASRIHVGKRHGLHAMTQEEINRLLVRLARHHRTVVRLKGGDPFVFGRGSEEALELVRHGIPFEVVPGITSASACTSYAGIPLTHRGLAEGVQFVTGHRRDGRPLDLDWQKLADPRKTLVIYMGLHNIGEISRSLIAVGLPPTTPAAAIANGTTGQQTRLISELARLPARVREAGLQAPVLFVIGEVVTLANRLDWFAPAASGEQDDEAARA